MGNNHSGISIKSAVKECSCHIDLGKSATIDLSQRKQKKKKNEGGIVEEWTALYSIHGKTCMLHLTKNDEKISLTIHDLETDSDTYVYRHVSEISEAEAGHLKLSAMSSTRQCMGMRGSQPIARKGGITETMYYWYGIGARRALVVVSLKKNMSVDEDPHTVTVAHYFAFSAVNSFFNITDIGLSVVVTVTASRGNHSLEYMVEGPVQHPASALFFMFDRAIATGSNWTPTACPHCAERNQRQRGGKYLQSDDSEDSDGFVGASQSLLANKGVTKGNGNGNFFVNKLTVGRRGRQPQY